MSRTTVFLAVIIVAALAFTACSGDVKNIGLNQEGDLSSEPENDTAAGVDDVIEEDGESFVGCGDGLCAEDEFETCPEDCAVDPFCGDDYCGG